jgi:hypothetical protein
VVVRVVRRLWVLLVARHDARHVRKICVRGARKREEATELLRLIGGFLVRVRVLLQTLDAVLHLWSPETCE